MLNLNRWSAPHNSLDTIFRDHSKQPAGRSRVITRSALVVGIVLAVPLVAILMIEMLLIGRLYLSFRSDNHAPTLLPTLLPDYHLPTSVPTDWSTYTSRFFPYTFKIPPTWRLTDDSGSQTGEIDPHTFDRIFITSPDLREFTDRAGYYGARILVSVRNNTGIQNLDTLYDYLREKFSPHTGVSYYNVYTKAYMTIDGVRALRVDIERELLPSGRGLVVATVRNGNIYVFTLGQGNVEYTCKFATKFYA